MANVLGGLLKVGAAQGDTKEVRFNLILINLIYLAPNS